MGINIRTGALMLAILLALTACAGAEVDPPDEPSAPATSSTSSTSTATPSTAPPSTAPPTTATSVALAPLEIPRLENGLPATFVAVTTEWEAVEVDTGTGQVVRSIGMLEAAGESDEEAGVLNAIQNVWRTADGEWHAISACCEPVAGAIYYIGDGETLSDATLGETTVLDGWTAAPSPFDGRLAKVGFTVDVFEVASEIQTSVQPDGGTGAMAAGTAAWHNDGRAVSWLVNGPAGPSVVTLDLDAPDAPLDVVTLDWVTDDHWLQGLGMQASGRFVAFRNTQSNDPEAPRLVSTEGVVFSPDGELVATFPVELGSFWGGYEPSGRYLVYVDGDGTVRWQGRGQSGALGDGFIHASW